MKVVARGVGITAFGEWWAKSALDLAKEAADEALGEAGMTLKDIDLLVTGNMCLPAIANQCHGGAYLASGIGFSGRSLAVEAACASGGLAIRQAVAAVLSGMVTRVLVLGVEKMTDVSAEVITKSLMAAADEGEQLAGATFPSLYGMMHRSYQENNELTDEQMAGHAVKNHYHGSMNPLAHFQKEVSVQDVVSSSMVADPIRLLHCSPVSDGAAAVVLEGVTAVEKGLVEVAGSGQGADTLALGRRESLTSMKATKMAAHEALKMAGVPLHEVDVVEVHGCFSVAEIMALEDLGLVPANQGAHRLLDGFGRLGGRGPTVNTSGGLKACGHPVGATGVKQLVEVVRQLTERAGKRQMVGARVGLTHNVGGTGATAVVHILRRAE
jgi:acetyl-CoA C-acetyltransferase